MNYRSIKGTKDMLPEESSFWQEIEEKARGAFKIFGYSEIRTPVIEETALFVKSVGEDTDIVSKEMFSFVDRGERNISLRPEGTAPIVRAYLEANLHKTDPFQKLYYIGPMFRAERPQAGRMRQFHQIGVEAIGSTRPALDAEVIRLMAAILDEAGIKDYTLKINNLGCADDKKKLSGALREALADKEKTLCDDCKRRIKVNPLRVLDCKNENCRTIVKGSFKAVKFLCEDCDKHFTEVLKHLDALKIKYTIDPHIVRGLDYYTQTVFEVTHGALGSQDAIGAGGRYDNLIKDMGGPALGAVGFALGMERVLMARGKEPVASSVTPSVYIATIGETSYKEGFRIANDLRNAGIACDIDYEGKSLKAQMRDADKRRVAFVLIIGEEEIQKGEAVLRNMVTKEQVGVKFEDIAETITAKIRG